MEAYRNQRDDQFDEPIEAVIERVRPKLQELIDRFRIPAHDAEDVLQQTFLVFLQKRALVRDDEAWLVCVARRYCLLYLRDRRTRFHQSLDEALLGWVGPDQERTTLFRELGRAIAKVPEHCRALLRMRYHLGHDTAEIADELGYRQSSVRKVASRCLAVLTRQMFCAGRRS